MPAYVVLHLAPAFRSRSARHDVETRLSRPDIARLIAQHHATRLPAPDAPGTGDSPSATFAVPDLADARALADALCALDEVETAYAKPADELP